MWINFFLFILALIFTFPKSLIRENYQSSDDLYFGIFTYRYRSTNIGDYIQSLAVLNILKGFTNNLECINDPELSQVLKEMFPYQTPSHNNRKIKLIVIDRDNINETANRFKDKTIHLIMNGWFMHPERGDSYNWPPPSNINPIFISFHISKDYLINNSESVKYLKKHAPIGCRDKTTVDKCKRVGIDAYFSGCLTLTMDSLKTSTDGPIYVVDSKSPNSQIVNVSHSPHFGTNSELFKKAYNLLIQYSKAQKIVTSRLHCCLPCLAMNKQVIFKSPSGVSTKLINEWGDKGRFTGLIEIMENPKKRHIMKQTLKSEINTVVQGILDK